MGLRFVCLLMLCVMAAGCATTAARGSNSSIHPPGGPVPADFSLCDLKPAPTACSIPDLALTAATARQRIDAEYARLRKAAPEIAPEFAVHSLGTAELSAGSPHYGQLRSRAWHAAFEATEEDGQRYFMLRDIGRAAFKAGDRPMARETIEQRRILIHRRLDDQEWKEWKGADVIHSLPREEAWFDTVRDAAHFGAPDLAISVLDEAVSESKRTSYNYLFSLAAIRLAAGQYDRLEAVARRIIETAPYRYGEMRDFGEDEKVGGHIFLIISLLKQGKETGDLAAALLYHVQDLPVSLRGHAENFFYTAHALAGVSPELARRFLEKGQMIDRIGGGTADFFSRYVEVDVCKALRDDACLLRIAQENEADQSRESVYFFESTALPYAIAGDFGSVRRLMPSTSPGHCYGHVYPAIAERLAQDKRLNAIPGWLRDWVACRIGKDPNYRLPVAGFAVNYWSEIAHAYAQVSHWQSDAGSHRAALISARMALLLAVELENSWKVKAEGARAMQFARAYGSALGALVRAEAALARRQVYRSRDSGPEAE